MPPSIPTPGKLSTVNRRNKNDARQELPVDNLLPVGNNGCMSYDDWKMTAPESDDEVCVECPICTGDNDAEPCGPECAVLVFKAKQIKALRGWYQAARNALKWARRYRQEDGPGFDRERDCLLEVRRVRDIIRTTRAMCATDVDAVLDVALRDDFLEAAQ